MKAVLITGAAKRIGLEIAIFFAKMGYNIAMHCNTSIKKANIEAEKIQKQWNIKCKVFVCDLSKPQNIENFFTEVINHFTKIDVLINNASIFEKSSIINSNFQTIMRDFNVHLFSPMLLCKAFAKQNLQNGNIINMLDKNITRTQTSYFSYIHSKKALYELTKYLAIEFAPNTRVNSISPGFILEEEDLTLNDEYFQRKISTIPTKTKGNIEQIILGIQYLLENEYSNGQNLFIDGGAFLLK